MPKPAATCLVVTQVDERFIAFCCVGLLACLFFGRGRAAASTPAPDGDPLQDGKGGFAVVELFTSEGCSSCPPADDVLRDLAAEAKRSDSRIYPLAFHVDYWDSLGWPDPFGSTAWTDRQHAYARALGQQGVYTPELIVNGRDAFVGSDASRARRSIDAARHAAVQAKIELRTTSSNAETSVDFVVSGAPKGTVLRLALVQVAAESRVRARENAGRTLRHANVVRAFRTMDLGGGASGRAAFSKMPGGSAAIIAYVQDPKTMRIVGATQAPL
jgi:hypothetical protein